MEKLLIQNWIDSPDAECPKIISEYLDVRFWYCVLWLIIICVLLIAGVIGLVAAINQDIITPNVAMGRLGSSVLLIICIMGFFCVFARMIKIVRAPKVFMADYLKSESCYSEY